MTRIYRYIQVHDTGMAPCVDQDRLTLATCKPKIRKRAEVGDWVIGFFSRRVEDVAKDIWAGQVANKFSAG